jgi:hypothetical protein
MVGSAPAISPSCGNRLGGRIEDGGSDDVGIFAPAHHPELQVGGIVAQYVEQGGGHLAGVAGVAVNHDWLIGGSLARFSGRRWVQGMLIAPGMWPTRNVPGDGTLRMTGSLLSSPSFRFSKGIGADDRGFVGAEVVVDSGADDVSASSEAPVSSAGKS